MGTGTAGKCNHCRRMLLEEEREGKKYHGLSLQSPSRVSCSTQTVDPGAGKGSMQGDSLVVQWLGLGTFTAKGQGSIPDQGTKIPQATQCGKKKKKKKKNIYIYIYIYIHIYSIEK